MLPSVLEENGDSVFLFLQRLTLNSPRHLSGAEAKTERTDAHYPDIFLFDLDKNNQERHGKGTCGDLVFSIACLDCRKSKFGCISRRRRLNKDLTVNFCGVVPYIDMPRNTT